MFYGILMNLMESIRFVLNPSDFYKIIVFIKQILRMFIDTQLLKLNLMDFHGTLTNLIKSM